MKFLFRVCIKQWNNLRKIGFQNRPNWLKLKSDNGKIEIVWCIVLAICISSSFPAIPCLNPISPCPVITNNTDFYIYIYLYSDRKKLDFSNFPVDWKSKPIFMQILKNLDTCLSHEANRSLISSNVSTIGGFRLTFVTYNIFTVYIHIYGVVPKGKASDCRRIQSQFNISFGIGDGVQSEYTQ